VNDISKTCEMKKYHNYELSCEHTIDFGCDECPFFQSKMNQQIGIEVDSGQSVLRQLWKDTNGIVPSTGKAWLVEFPETEEN